ncbi:hypothetical protein Q3G72_003451 [Acer saccharum]|nr:hypothetical protein Q3G72_003451 [Acer saccharum]
MESENMGDRLHLAVGAMGIVASLLRFASPILTFSRIIKGKSTEEFSCIPYIISLLSCLNYTWYGLPIVSNKLENIPLVTVSGFGILLQTSYIGIYFRFATSKAKASYYFNLILLDETLNASS